MKKQLLFIGALALTFISNSQITVVDTDMISVGGFIVQARDTVSSITPTPSGPSQTWDLTSLLAQKIDTTIGIDPSTTTFASNFPSANLALENTDGTLLYFDKSASSFKMVGAFFMGFPVQFEQTIINFPASYNDIFSTTISSTATAPGSALGQQSIDSIRRVSNGTRSSHIDAYGMLTTPLGLFDVIRQNDTSYTTTEVYIKVAGLPWGPTPATTETDTTYQHVFLSNNASAKYPLATYEIDRSGNYKIGTVQWLQTSSPASINTNVAEKLSIYPNPTSNSININLNENIDLLTISDMTGKIILTNSMLKTNTIDVSKLTKGVYHITATSNNKTYINKFIKE